MLLLPPQRLRVTDAASGRTWVKTRKARVASAMTPATIRARRSCAAGLADAEADRTVCGSSGLRPGDHVVVAADNCANLFMLGVGGGREKKKRKKEN